MLQGPLSSCHVDSWYTVVAAALPAVRNSPFCDGGLLNHLNEALMDTTIDWTHVPPCDSCHVVCTSTILSEVAGQCAFKAGGSGCKKKKRCLVFGSCSVWGISESQIGDLVLTFSSEPSFPERGSVLLHDGEPLYQQQLLRCVIFALQSLSSGDALLLPVFSALTRVTAAVVLCLHICFRSVSFRCPPPSGVVGTVLVCVGFCPEAAAQMLLVLSDVQKITSQLLRDEEGKNEPSRSDRQVLQFVPMEEMLSGGLTEFLWTVNSEIIQWKLHLLMQS